MPLFLSACGGCSICPPQISWRFKLRDMHLEIVEVPTDSLIPYENNANIHSEHQVDQIANSIKEFGFADPIGVWENAEGQIEVVEGHGRVLAAKKIGYDKVPVIYLNGLTDDQRRAYTHIHNQLTRNSEFDWNVLDAELAKLDFEWDSFGFDDSVSMDGFDTEFSLPDGDKPEMCTMSFQVHVCQKELIEKALEAVKDQIEETFGNTNRNGNALYEVVRQWDAQRK